MQCQFPARYCLQGTRVLCHRTTDLLAAHASRLCNEHAMARSATFRPTPCPRDLLHCSMPLAPASDVVMPSPHSVHTSAPSALYVPIAQGTHCTPLGNLAVPAGQTFCTAECVQCQRWGDSTAHQNSNSVSYLETAQQTTPLSSTAAGQAMHMSPQCWCRC